MTDCYVMFLGS